MVGGRAGSGVRREQGCSCRQQGSVGWRLLLSQAAAPAACATSSTWRPLHYIFGGAMAPWYCRYELPGDYGTFFLQVRCAVPALCCVALCCAAVLRLGVQLARWWRTAVPSLPAQISSVPIQADWLSHTRPAVPHIRSASGWFEVTFSFTRHCPVPAVPLRRGGMCPSGVQPAQQPHPLVKCVCVFLWRPLTHASV